MLDQISKTTRNADCKEQIYLLSVYEAGHALTARALGLKIVSIRMFPRPPVLVSEKAFASNNWPAFIETLEIRVIELFGGQIAEEHVCGSNACCSGDIARIDELCRLISGLSGDEDPETTMFRLEDEAQKIFAEPKVREAIVPVAEFFNSLTVAGTHEISGPQVEVELDKWLPFSKQPSWLKKTFGG